MLEQPGAISITLHDCWPESALALLNVIPAMPCKIKGRIEQLAQKISAELKSAVFAERRFSEQNDKTMYITPFFVNILHVAAPEVELEQISFYPLAMDPCFARDPLLGLLPQYGHATAIMCAPVPLKGSSRDSSSEPTNNSPDNMSFGMTGHSERGISEGSFSKSQGNGSMLDEDHDSSEDVQSKWNDNANWDVDARDYFCPATEYGTETNFYHDPQGTPASKRLRSSSNLPDHRFLACLTVDLTEDTTPLALVCLAQDTEIHSALSSAMFQRLAWGILDPLIGVSFDRMNTTVRVVLGWLEERHDLGCPIVHVAYEPASIYDLSDPQQGLKFALLIGSEAGRFAYYQQRALEHYPRLLDNISEGRLMLWRIDQQALAPQFEHRETHADSRLQRWLDLTDSSNFVAPEKEITYTESSRETRKLRQASPTSSIVSNTTEYVRRISAGTLAAGGIHADKSYLIRLFMLDRLAMTRTLPVFSMLSNPKYEIDPTFARVCEGYYGLTSFAWLDNDTKESRLGDDTKKFHVVQHAEWAFRRLDSLTNIGRFPSVEPLSVACSEILAENLWMVEDVLCSVRQLRGQGWKQVKEVECRIYFDRLFTALFHGKADGTASGLADGDYVKTPHVMVSLEQNLQLPQGDVSVAISSFWANKAYRELNKITEAMSKVHASDHIALETFADELQSEPESAPFSPPTVTMHDPAALISMGDRSTSDLISGGVGDAEKMAHRSYAEACAQLSLREHIIRMDEYLVDVENTHKKFAINTSARHGEEIVSLSEREPERVVCDSIAYLRIPSVFQSIESAAAFNMIRSPASSPGRSPEVGGHTANTSRHYEGLSGLRQDQMIRTFHPENSTDIYSTAQNYAVAAKALLEDCKEVLVLDEEPVPGIEKHNLNRPIRTDGTPTIQDNVLDMRRVHHTSIATGVFQGRMHAIASTKYYAALGIYGVPVYVIITEGPMAVVTVTYAEKWVDHPFDKKKYEMSDECSTPQPMPTKVHIIERNVVSFDISDPSGILNFATFLIKLRVEHVPKVLKQLSDVL